jgi:hypothetical protein
MLLKAMKRKEFQVRLPQSGWLDEWGRLKGGRPLSQRQVYIKFFPYFTTEGMLCIFPKLFPKYASFFGKARD